MNQTKLTIKTVGNQQLTFKKTNGGSEGVLALEACPLSGTNGKTVQRLTMTNHVLPKYWPSLSDDNNYFCPHQRCPVIYFNNQTHVYFSQHELRTPVMHKMPIQAENRPMCYCTGVLEQQIIEELVVKQCCDSLKDIREYTGANLKHKCTITNPSGRCCGRQIQEVIDWAKIQQLAVSEALIKEAGSHSAAIIKIKPRK